MSQPCPGLQAIHFEFSQKIELPADLLKSHAGLFQHGHTQGTAAGRLEAGRAPTRVAEEGSGGKLARFSKLGTSGKQDRSSTSPSLPGCQVARLPGCLVHTIESLQPAAAHASAICERSPLLALRAPSMSCGPNLARGPQSSSGDLTLLETIMISWVRAHLSR